MKPKKPLEPPCGSCAKYNLLLAQPISLPEGYGWCEQTKGVYVRRDLRIKCIYYDVYRCDRCGYMHGRERKNILPFGDGVTSRYSTVDALLKLGYRLNMQNISLALYLRLLLGKGALAKVDIQGQDRWINSHTGERDTTNEDATEAEIIEIAVTALSEAILRAFGRWSE